jgi:hypothetical protein
MNALTSNQRQRKKLYFKVRITARVFLGTLFADHCGVGSPTNFDPVRRFINYGIYGTRDE